MLLRIASAFAALALSFAAAAQEDWQKPHVENAKEHPLVRFYPQSSVYDYSAADFDSAEIMTGYDKGKQEPVMASIEGRVTRYDSLHKPGTSPLEILRNYENALKKAGFVTMISGKGEQYPGSPVNSNETFGTFRLDRNGVPAAYVQVWGQGLIAGPYSRVTIVEVKAMEQKLEANADAWYDEIAKSGRVAVYGVNFDTGKSTIRAESEPVLGEILKLAKDHADLKLTVEGHTDNAGNPAANRKLSEERAAAVKAWLVAKGVKADRLATAGFGDTKPAGDNKTDEGRAQNRRVELVKR
jgi:OmpA-OmpF porin, OOP family